MTPNIKTIERLLEKRGAHPQYCAHYGEPGYSNPEKGIVFANWNHVNRRVSDWLENHGFAVEWSDEWIIAHETDKAYRTSRRPRQTGATQMNLQGMTQDRWDAMTPLQRSTIRDRSALTAQFVGIEGWRVEVIDEPGDAPRRFYIGISTGWRPCHLELHNRHSMGGNPASGRYHSVRKLYHR